MCGVNGDVGVLECVVGVYWCVCGQSVCVCVCVCVWLCARVVTQASGWGVLYRSVSISRFSQLMCVSP